MPAGCDHEQSTMVISSLIISQQRLFRYFCVYIHTYIRSVCVKGRLAEEGGIEKREREKEIDRSSGNTSLWWTIKAILGRTLVKTHFVASLNPDNSTLRLYPPITRRNRVSTGFPFYMWKIFLRHEITAAVIVHSD